MNVLNAEVGVLLGEMDATQAGQVMGQTLVLIGLFAGAWKCWSISDRPATNRKCVLALMLVLLAWFASCVVAVLKPKLASSGLYSVVSGILGLAFLGLSVGALVLAILGLSELSRNPGVWAQGRAQAIWALVLSSFIGIAFAIGFVYALTRNNGLASGRGVTQHPGQTLTFEEFNFRFRSPDRPWVSFDAQKFNKDSKLGFMRREPEVYFLIIPENLGMEDFASEQLAEIGKANLESAAQSCKVLRESPQQMNGITGLLVETEATKRNLSFYYQHWYIATNGYAYQLIGYGRAQDRNRIAAELRHIFARFELIDPTRIGSAGSTFTTNFVSPRFPYSVEISNSSWHTSSSLKKDFPEAEFAAGQAGSFLAVAPVFLPEQQLSADALTAGLLALMNIEYPNESLTAPRPLRLGTLEGQQFDFVREVNNHTYRYRLGILQTNDLGFLVAAWTVKGAEQAEPILADALARVRFSTPTFALLSAGQEPSATEQKTQGLVFNQAGLYYYRAGEYQKALPLFRAAAQANGHDRLYRLNALQAWSHLDRPKEALDFLAGLSPSVLEAPETRAWQAYFQAEASLTDLALTNYSSLFATGYRNESHFVHYLELLKLQGQYDLALEQIRKYLQEANSLPVRLAQASIYSRQQDFTNALALLKTERQKAPSNRQVTEALAQTSLEAGLYHSALDLCSELIKTEPDSAFTYHLKGRCELGLKWYREAKSSFEAAAKLAPANKDILSYLNYVSGLLGEGSNTDLKEPIEMVAFPADLTNIAREVFPTTQAKKYGAYYVYRLVAASWTPTKEYRTTDSVLVRVLDSSGVEAFSTVQVPFDPLSEQIFVNEVRVTDAAGQAISSGKVADYYLLDDPSKQLVTHKKILNVPIPGLQPGCDLALTITRRQLGRLEEFPFLEHTFACHFPAQTSIFFLAGDANGLKYRASSGLAPEKMGGGLCWRVKDPMIARREPLQAPASTYLPMLWIGDGSTQWPGLATNYLASISDRLAAEPAVQAQARRVCSGLTAQDSKISALAQYVQTNCVYKALEFGRRARVPNGAGEVLRNKYGDCKDHAVLLQQMLQAVDVPAQLALVNPHSPVQMDLPSLDQFAHMIVFVPSAAGGRFLDCTEKGSDPAHELALGLAQNQALILDPGKPRFATIPPYADNVSSFDVQRRLRLARPADLAVNETLLLNGAYAAYMRDVLRTMSASSRRLAMQRQLGLDAIELADFNIDSLEAAGRPLRFDYSYLLKNQFHQSNRRLAVILRAPPERSLLAADPVDNRLSPFELKIPLAGRTRIAFEIPSGFSAEPPADPAPQLDPRFGSCRAASRVETNRFVLQFDCRRPAGNFAAADYPAFRETMSQVLSLLEREITLIAAD